MTEIPTLTDLFTNPLTIAALAAALAYLIPLALRTWFDIPPAPVALVVAVLVWVGGQLLSPEQQSLIIDLLVVLLTTLSAMGISLFVHNRKIKQVAPDTVIQQDATPWWFHF